MKARVGGTGACAEELPARRRTRIIHDQATLRERQRGKDANRYERQPGERRAIAGPVGRKLVGAIQLSVVTIGPPNILARPTIVRVNATSPLIGAV